MAAVLPYLNFNGNTEEAFNFYRNVFGGEFTTLMRFRDVPSEYKMSDAEGDKIMHVSLPIGEGTILMGSDVPQAMGQVVMGTNFYVSIHTTSEDEANKLFSGLTEGGHVAMPLEKSFWGSYFGMFRDKYGIQWMVSYEYSQNNNN
jgi:PhnB protein